MLFRSIFTAQRKQLVLPTIRSRCVIQSYGTPFTNNDALTFGTHFMSFASDPHAFLKELSTTQITEIESRELVDLFLEYWCTHYKKAVAARNNTQITQGFRHCFATGNWGMQKQSYFRTGVSQVLSRLTYSATISHLRQIGRAHV